MLKEKGTTLNHYFHTQYTQPNYYYFHQILSTPSLIIISLIYLYTHICFLYKIFFWTYTLAVPCLWLVELWLCYDGYDFFFSTLVLIFNYARAVVLHQFRLDRKTYLVVNAIDDRQWYEGIVRATKLVSFFFIGSCTFREQ